jgi:predicted RNase H-like nuclease
VILVINPGASAAEEARSLVDSSDSSIVAVPSQEYLNHSQYGNSSEKAEEIKGFVRVHNRTDSR